MPATANAQRTPTTDTPQPRAVELEVFPKQQRVIESQKRVVLALGAKQSSKTWACLIALLLRIINTKNGQWILGAPTYGLIQDNTRRKFKEVCNLIPNVWLGENKNLREIYLAGDNVVYLRNADDPTQWEGKTLDGGMLDDAHRMPEIIYKSLLQRTNIKRGQIFLAAAVPDPGTIRGHWLWSLYQRALNNDPYIDYIHFSVLDNPFFSKSEIERAKLEYTPEEYKAWVEGLMDIDFQSDYIFNPEDIRKAQQLYPDVIQENIPKKLYQWVRARQYLKTLPELDFPEKTFSSRTVRIGVDPARLGGDATGISIQYSYYVVGIEDWGSMDMVQLEGRLIDMNRELRELGFFPTFYVDVTGLGQGIPDHLIQHGCSTFPVYYSSTDVTDPKLFYNKKAELYFFLNSLLMRNRGEFVLPPNEKLIVQASGARYKYQNSKRAIQEQTPSPDLLDALCIGLAGYHHGNMRIETLG